jgi:hypothetical protein
MTAIQKMFHRELIPKLKSRAVSVELGGSRSLELGFAIISKNAI